MAAVNTFLAVCGVYVLAVVGLLWLRWLVVRDKPLWPNSDFPATWPEPEAQNARTRDQPGKPGKPGAAAPLPPATGTAQGGEPR